MFLPLYHTTSHPNVLESHGLLFSRGSKGFSMKRAGGFNPQWSRIEYTKGSQSSNTGQARQRFHSPSEGQAHGAQTTDPQRSGQWHSWAYPPLVCGHTESAVQRDLEHKPPFTQTCAFCIQTSNHFYTADLIGFGTNWWRNQGLFQRSQSHFLQIHDCVLGHITEVSSTKCSNPSFRLIIAQGKQM